MHFLIIIEKAGSNLSAWFPDVPGCGTVGDTVEEVLVNAREALELHFEDGATPPAARPLKAIVDEGIDLDGTEVVAWISYEPAEALATT